MTLHGVFDRFPDLKIYFAENQIGWIPLFLQQLDRQYGRSYHWAMKDLGLEPLQSPPSEYIGNTVTGASSMTQSACDCWT